MQTKKAELEAEREISAEVERSNVLLTASVIVLILLLVLGVGALGREVGHRDAAAEAAKRNAAVAKGMAQGIIKQCDAHSGEGAEYERLGVCEYARKVLDTAPGSAMPAAGVRPTGAACVGDDLILVLSNGNTRTVEDAAVCVGNTASPEPASVATATETVTVTPTPSPAATVTVPGSTKTVTVPGSTKYVTKTVKATVRATATVRTTVRVTKTVKATVRVTVPPGKKRGK